VIRARAIFFTSTALEAAMAMSSIDEKPRTHQADLRKLHPAIVKRMVPLPNWVNWKWQPNEKGTGWTKVPYQPQAPTRKAASNNKATWGTYTDAVANVEAGKADGIGFELFETNICAFDIDDCRDLTGRIDPVAIALMRRCGATYFENTVGGRGLRCIGLGGSKKTHRKQKIVGSAVSVESYRYCERFITISNMVLDSVKPTMADLGNIDAVITAVVEELDRQDLVIPSPNSSERPIIVDNNKNDINDDRDGSTNAFMEASLPDDLLTLIRYGVAVGERSDQFHHAVKWLKDLEWSLADIVALLKHYPDGIANKYVAGNRINAEAARVYGKPDKEPNTADADDIATKEAKAAPKLILSSEQFTRDFVPPDYLWDGILLRGYVYSYTARTGEGKTAVGLSLSAAIAIGKEFAGREVTQGTVLYFAGENPDDVRMRWLAMAEHMNFDSDTIDVHFIPGTFNILSLESKIREEVATINGVIFVVIDTSPAYYQGETENDNVQMMAHARMLRRLDQLPGHPTVLAMCHPVKGAGNDALVPRGGGSFMNELDGNLCSWKTDMMVTLHHQGKFRGVDFEPMSFELMPVTARKLIDSKGRQIPTVISKDLSKDDQRQRTTELRSEQDDILIVLLGSEDAISWTEIAFKLNWFNNKGDPNKSRVQRLMQALTSGSKDKKLVETDRDGNKLTKAGRAAAEKAKLAKAGRPAKSAAEKAEASPDEPIPPPPPPTPIRTLF
jgi:hypothetical protein